eukprot:g15812.t1
MGLSKRSTTVVKHLDNLSQLPRLEVIPPFGAGSKAGASGIWAADVPAIKRSHQLLEGLSLSLAALAGLADEKDEEADGDEDASGDDDDDDDDDDEESAVVVEDERALGLDRAETAAPTLAVAAPGDAEFDELPLLVTPTVRG